MTCSNPEDQLCKNREKMQHRHCFEFPKFKSRGGNVDGEQKADLKDLRQRSPKFLKDIGRDEPFTQTDPEQNPFVLNHLAHHLLTTGKGGKGVGREKRGK